VTLKLSTDATQGNFRVAIYDATGTNSQPGAQVAEIHSGSVTTLTAQYADFHIGNLNVQLGSDQMYYVVLQSTGLENEEVFVNWQYTTAPPPRSHGKSSIFWQSFDGSTWESPFVGEPQLMRVVAVPEPGTYALAGLGVLVLGAFGRRRSRKA
jgi:hypothetical protein